MAGEITALLHQWRDGGRHAEDALFSRVHHELLKMASFKLAKERVGHTLEPAALVNETFMKLAREGKIEWRDRQHFFAIASKQMWRVLTDHGRKRASKKRDSARMASSPADEGLDSAVAPEDRLAISQALEALGRKHLRSSEVITLRIFAGLTWPEVAKRLGTSVATAKNDWAYGKAFLFGRFGGPD